MTEAERYTMYQAMTSYGGGFITALCHTYQAADSFNQSKLDQAFPEVIAKYGPAGDFYKVIKNRENSE